MGRKDEKNYVTIPIFAMNDPKQMRLLKEWLSLEPLARAAMTKKLLKDFDDKHSAYKVRTLCEPEVNVR